LQPPKSQAILGVKTNRRKNQKFSDKRLTKIEINKKVKINF